MEAAARTDTNSPQAQADHLTMFVEAFAPHLVLSADGRVGRILNKSASRLHGHAVIPLLEGVSRIEFSRCVQAARKNVGMTHELSWKSGILLMVAEDDMVLRLDFSNYWVPINVMETTPSMVGSFDVAALRQRLSSHLCDNVRMQNQSQEDVEIFAKKPLETDQDLEEAMGYMGDISPTSLSPSETPKVDSPRSESPLDDLRSFSKDVMLSTPASGSLSTRAASSARRASTSSSDST